MRRPSWRTVRSIASWAALVLFVLGWAALLRPPSLGGGATIVGVSGISMKPTMDDGDLTVIRKRASYGVGDVIAYRIPEGQPGAGNNIVHRIVDGDAENGFVTRGDNNKGVDIWRPTDADVLGEVSVHIPHLAGWIGSLRTPVGTAALAGLVTFGLIMLPGRRHEDDAEVTPPAAPLPRAVEVGIAGVVSAVVVHQLCSTVRNSRRAA